MNQFAKSLLKSLILFTAVIFLLASPLNLQPLPNILAQTSNPELSPEQRKVLEAQLAEIEQEIAAQQQILDQKRQEGSSIAGDIAILNAQIKQAQLKIQAHNLAINKLGKDITVKVQLIDTLNTHIGDEQESLGQIIRETNQLDSYSLAEAILSKQALSDFLLDMDTFATINQSLKDKMTAIESAKSQSEQEKSSLDQKRNQEIDTKVNVENEQAKIKTAQNQKQTLLNINKNQQQSYQTVIANKEADAARIRNTLFPLRDAPSIKFGDALTYATAASKVTGVDPAFVLAIMTQESNLGSNVGQCYLVDPATGAGKGKNTGTPFPNLMKASRDVIPFLDITKKLGRDPFSTVVSCSQSVGYGGAMGPAQFIPSTWKIMESKIIAATGKSVADPWNPQDAIMASSLFLRDLGAVSGSYTSEIVAACKYYGSGGSSCAYGNQVMAKVQDIQANINVLNS